MDDIACRPAQTHELAAVAELRWRWVQELYGTPDTTLEEVRSPVRGMGPGHRVLTSVHGDGP